MQKISDVTHFKTFTTSLKTCLAKQLRHCFNEKNMNCSNPTIHIFQTRHWCQDTIAFCDDSWVISIVRLNTVVIIRSAEDELLLEVREAPALLSHLSKDPSLSWTYLKPCCGPGTCFGPCSKTTMNCIKSVAWLFILLFGSRWATQLMQRKAKTT